ncbi:hypothetical protein ACEWY4_003654 [Coilia grayii]|uniref:Putative nuclease HARBI1 n=1 Tax=Coilia grayii TaxID=363190 RepID=A0ABD1KRU8_9TELE
MFTICIFVFFFQARRPLAYCQLNINVPIIRLWLDVERELSPEFRLSRKAMHAVQRLLRRSQDHGWGHELEVLVYVYWLAHGLSYRVTASVFHIPRSTVHRMVHKVAQLIWKNLHRAITFPLPADLDNVASGFELLSGSPAFNRAVGAIDGSHIRIKPPSIDRLDYLNYKGFYSIIMQAVCDSEGKFLDIFVGYPGSVHDTRVLKNSPLYVNRTYPPPGYFLLGDGGYPCLERPICLIAPYKEPVAGRVERRFNFHHSKARSVVERAFGMMKTRWRATLFKALEVKATFAPVVTASCAFLHNICLENGDQLEPDEDAQDHGPNQDFQGIPDANEMPGNAARDRVANLI